MKPYRILNEGAVEIQMSSEEPEFGLSLDDLREVF